MPLPAPKPVPPRLAAGVTRLGFRKWYERELLGSHAHLVLALLALIATVASLEVIGGGTPAERLMDAAFVLLSGGITLWALRRYLYLLMRAEDLANQATCESCQAYGRFSVEEEHRPSRTTRVRCTRCGHRWNITES